MIRKEDKFLEGQILDKLLQCEENQMFTYTSFLDLHQQSIAQQILQRELKKRDCFAIFYGGYEEAIRRVLFFFPQYLEETWKEFLKEIIVAVEVKQENHFYSLTHRDFLGAFVGLGMKREMMGDILIQKSGVYFFFLEEVLSVVLHQYNSVGKSSVSLEQKDLFEIQLEEEERESKRGTVSSNRLDNILSMAFQVSRTQAQEWIQQGIVFVNYVEKNKNETVIKEEEIIVVRGQGKIRIERFGDLTRKEKIPVFYIRY